MKYGQPPTTRSIPVDPVYSAWSASPYRGAYPKITNTLETETWIDFDKADSILTSIGMSYLWHEEPLAPYYQAVDFGDSGVPVEAGSSSEKERVLDGQVSGA